MSYSQNQNQNQNRYNSLGLNESDFQIINMLNNMYNNNNIIMERLLNSNNEIIRIIQSVLNQNQNQNQNIQPPNVAGSNNRNTRRTQQREPTSISLPTFIEGNLLTIPELYNNSIVLDYDDSISTDQIAELLQSFMTPIVITPTQVEIENATSLIRFDEIVNPLNNSCPISLEPFIQDEVVTMIKYCGHVFKTNEINHWFESNVRCPVCRYDIRTFRSRLNTNINTNTNANTNINRTLLNQNNQDNQNNQNNQNNNRREERTNRRGNLTLRNNPRINSNEGRSRLIDNFLLNFTISDISNNNYTL